MVKRRRPNARTAAFKHGASSASIYSARAYLRALCEALDALGVPNPFPPSTLPRPERRQRRWCNSRYKTPLHIMGDL